MTTNLQFTVVRVGTYLSLPPLPPAPLLTGIISNEELHHFKSVESSSIMHSSETKGVICIDEHPLPLL